ncbi:histidine kinase [Paenibacillus yonginensis]|uniref:histidine kinase n=1 Tax=Paenibacillus yonginensis TaxID=1462996 RepID=A0A1B1N1F6_9BACL|nr:sensor histidine kinase KdpD [Paenibacillus yonginensis]ANS75241.1 histidine kinase [Paenibacillus yonginensis]
MPRDSNSASYSPDQAGRRRGKLKIFLGYTPGPAKTAAMLGNAQRDARDGMDVVLGLAGGHPMASSSGFDKIEPIWMPTPEEEAEGHYEFDLDAALRRNPDMILLEQLAHVNAEGCRHKRRYQDVEELLRAGIHVYTTLDIQQIESLTDIAASITGISVQERIPDSVFERADLVELVDADPDELADRYRKGRMRPDELVQDGQDISGLYVPEKLRPLREIALKTAAQQLRRIAMLINEQAKKEDNPYKDHILVCLSPAPSNQKVIRTAARMAEVFHGQFTALYVEAPERETGDARNSDQATKMQLRENLKLAEQLGAQIATVYGDDISVQIAEYVKMSRVTKVVIGRSPVIKKAFYNTSIVDRLIPLIPNSETYIIPYVDNEGGKKFRFPATAPLPTPKDSLKSLVILLVCTLFGVWFKELGFREANIITLYLLGVLLNATITKGRFYSAILSLLSVLVFNYFFTTPYYSLKTYDSGNLVTFVVMLTASLLASTLTMRVREQARQAAQKAYRTEILLETSRKLQQAGDAPAIIEGTARQLVKLLDRAVVFYPVERNKLASPIVFPNREETVDPSRYTDESEQAVANWVFANNKRAGATTDTFFGARCLYHAVRGGEEVLAVSAIVMDEGEVLGSFEQSLVIAMLGECALALEKEKLNEQQKEITMQVRQEQLRANLLRSISHDLRTPLTSISGNAGILLNNSRVLDEEQRIGLYADIYDDSIWLINLVENLLSISRIDNGTMRLNLQAELIDEVIMEALRHVNRNSEKHILRTEIEDELLMARMDSRLVVQVLINLVDNAIKYTQEGSVILISARKSGESILVEVSDDGPGIPDDVKERLFEMFYTGNNVSADGRRGLGLGLALCQTIIQAHGGTIGVRDHSPRGSVFYFTLRAEEVNIHE